MALTNDQIVAKNFKQFYQQIKPFLNPTVTTGFTPIGTMVSIVGTTPPLNYLKCDGTIYNVAEFPDLAEYFNRQFGSKNYFGGDGTNTFAVPNVQDSALTIYCIACKNIYVEIFDKSDLYSTDEKAVGEWIDGKPIYQKCLTGTFTFNSGVWTATTIQSGTVDNLISCNVIDTSGSAFQFPCTKGTTYVEIYNSMPGKITVGTIILQYTKVS